MFIVSYSVICSYVPPTYWCCWFFIGIRRLACWIIFSFLWSLPFCLAVCIIPAGISTGHPPPSLPIHLQSFSLLYEVCWFIISKPISSRLISHQIPPPSPAACSANLITPSLTVALLIGSCLRIKALGSLPTTTPFSTPKFHPTPPDCTVVSTHQICNSCTIKPFFYQSRTSCRFSNALCSYSHLNPLPATHLIFTTHAPAPQSISLYS